VKGTRAEAHCLNGSGNTPRSAKHDDLELGMEDGELSKRGKTMEAGAARGDARAMNRPRRRKHAGRCVSIGEQHVQPGRQERIADPVAQVVVVVDEQHGQRWIRRIVLRVGALIASARSHRFPVSRIEIQHLGMVAGSVWQR